jgi:hypothetical protein
VLAPSYAIIAATLSLYNADKNNSSISVSNFKIAL